MTMTNMLDVPLLAEYGTYHRDKRNRLCHEIGIPLIVLSIIIAERLVHVGVIDLAMLTIVAISVYYVRLVGLAAIVAIVSLIVLYGLAMFLTWPYAIAAFVIGWALQFIGHAYEGKKPAFLTNLLHLLVGPLWITALLTSRRSAA
jgi:uncharacterized membrane protein YGL010W